MHLMSYDILINFVNTQWPDILKLWQYNTACRVYILYNVQWFISCLTLLIATEIVSLKHSLQSACMLHYVP